MIEVQLTTLPEQEALKLKASAGYLVTRRTDGKVLASHPAADLDEARAIRDRLLRENSAWPIDIFTLYSRTG